jgi:poly(3-hydroxybutyrate) depolymerase
MPSNRGLKLSLATALACALTAPLPARADGPGPLKAYNADISESSISGISSGAFMAVQFGTAWSSVIKGVGVVAGGPYYCAQATAADIGGTLATLMATGPCMQGPPSDLNIFIKKADDNAAAGSIDPTSGLSHQKIYLFHGTNDKVVASSDTDAAADFYRHYLGQASSGNLFYQNTVGAGHSLVVLQEPQAQGLNNCPVNQSPYINQCNYDQAGIILQHIYGALNPRNPGELSGTLMTFAQATYTKPNAPNELSMGDTGYVYVPKDCEQGAGCRVHIALHGCKQDAGDIGSLYVDDTGYNAWADTNRIIILYPQTAAPQAFKSQVINPQACWDWWGYVDQNDDYVTKSGRQITAIKSMLDALTAAQKPIPQQVAAAGLAPTTLLVTDVTDTAAALAWTPVPGANSYQVSRAGADGNFVPVGGVLLPSFGDSGLQPSTSYRWRVTAVVNGKEGPASPVASGTTVPTPASCWPGECPVTALTP